MSAYALHVSGDCSDSCPVCLNTCDACGHVGLPCDCPQLPIEETP